MEALTPATLTIAGQSIEIRVDAAALSRALCGDEPRWFTSADLPPGVSRRAFNARCRTLPAATKAGRTWSVPQAEWWAACRRGSSPRAVPQGDTDATALLASAGLRLKGQGRER